MDEPLLEQEPPETALLDEPETPAEPPPVRQPGKLIKVEDMPPEEFFSLCLREEQKEIRFMDFGPGRSNGLWTVRYWELPKESVDTPPMPGAV